MKRKMKHLFNEFQRFLTLQRRFNQKVTTWMAIKAAIMSISWVTIIMLIPVLLSINLLIFDGLKYVILGFLIIALYVSVRLYYIFYKKLIVTYKPEAKLLNLSFMFKIERILIYIVLTILGIIILSAII